MNPMIRKELRQRMRDRRAWMLPSLYLAALGGAVALAYYFATGDPFGMGAWKEVQGSDIGVAIFISVVFTQMALLLLIAPVFSAGALTIEKEQRTLGALLTSLLTPNQIWWGKFVAALLFLALLLAAALPVLSLSFSLGGVGPQEVAGVTAISLFILASVTTVGLYCSSYFRRSVHATAVCYVVVIALTLLTYVAHKILTWRWEASVGNLRYMDRRPWYVDAPLYLNPFFALAGGGNSTNGPYPDWLISLQLFAALGCIFAALALRNLVRSGEEV